jgi:methylmalonyl-CoA mutase
MSDAQNSATDQAAGAASAAAARWRALVAKVLAGKDFETLVHESADGIAIQPLYDRPATAPPPILRGRAPAWQVLARIDHPDPQIANQLAAAELANGANGLHLVFRGAQGAYGFGIAGADRAAIAALLDAIAIEDGVAIEIDLSPEARDAPANLAALALARRADPESFAFSCGFDPLGVMAARGGTPLDWSVLAPATAVLVNEFATRGLKGPFFVADGRAVHAAGGSEAQELAFALSAALAYLRALEGTGVALAAARRMISFRLAADAEIFLTVAKFRALRLLWARIEEACGLSPAPVRIHAETAWRMMSARDPWTNILRATIAAAAAGIGGADAISILPFTQAIGLPDAFARRIARNTQLILIEEANLAKVVDPAAGAGGFGALTAELAATAWALMQMNERDGGLYGALCAGRLQADIASLAGRRERDIAVRKIPLTGVSEFPDAHERPVEVLEKIPAPAPPVPTAIRFAALSGRRDAASYERLRDIADAFAARHGTPPRVFLANFGPIAAFTARATFAKNLFEAGGIVAIGNDGFASAEAAAAAFAASGAPLACLCSSDQLYGESGPDVAAALAAAGARHIYLAGRPREGEAALRAAGVTQFIHAGCDAPALLEAALGFAASTSMQGERHD